MGKFLLTLMFLIFVDTMKSSDEACVDGGCVCKVVTMLNGTIEQMSAVFCTNENISLIHSVLSSSSDKINRHFEMIYIANRVANKLHARFLGKVNASSVYLQLLLVEAIDDDAFIGQEGNIEDLHITETSLSKIPIRAVRNLHRLTNFYIQNAFNIQNIEEKCFHPLSSSAIESLQRFALSYSNLRFIGNEAFTVLKKLKVLILQNSQLKYFPCGVLPKHEISLEINRNNFKDMQINVLNDSARHSVINYGNNNISSTSSKQWKLIIQKELVVHLHGNSIDCNCALIPLVKLPESKKKEIVKTLPFGGKEYNALCATPEHLKNRTISSLTMEDLASQKCRN